MPLSSNDRRTLIAILGKLGSDHPGERESAVQLAEKLRKRNKLTWDELISPVSALPRPVFYEPPRPVCAKPPPRSTIKTEPVPRVYAKMWSAVLYVMCVGLAVCGVAYLFG